MLRILFAVILSAVITSVQAATIINYDLGSGWTYEADAATVITAVPGGGISIDINVPASTDEGGMSASRHDLAGLSLGTDSFVELHYSDYSSTSVGSSFSSVDLEIEFFDTNNHLYEMGFALAEISGTLNFAASLTTEAAGAMCDVCFDDINVSPVSIDIREGILGNDWLEGKAIAYFIDNKEDIIFPYAGCDMSGFVGTHSFTVDNDFAANTGASESVVASVIFDHVEYGAVVPLPAAAWLFGSALGLLGWMRRKAS